MRIVDLEADGQSIRIPTGGSFKIIEISDVHIGSRSCHYKAFEQCLKTYAAQKNTYFKFNGDMISAIGPKDRRHRYHEVSPRFQGEKFLKLEVEYLIELCRKHGVTGERVLGVLLGNHEDQAIQLGAGWNPVEEIVEGLETRYLGMSCFLRTPVKVGKNGRFGLTSYSHHGFGGSARTEGGDITKYSQHSFRHRKADYFVYGHSHRLFAHPVVIVDPNWTKKELVPRVVWVVNPGTFQATVAPGGDPVWSETKGFNPTIPGLIEMTVTHRRTRKKLTDGKQRTNERLRIEAAVKLVD